MPTWVAVVSICGVRCCSITWPIVSWRFQSSVYPPSLSFKFRGIGKLCLDLLFVLLSLDSWNWMLTLNFWLAVHSLHVFGSAELLAFQPFQSFMYTYCLIIWGYLFCLLFASGCLANKVTHVSLFEFLAPVSYRCILALLIIQFLLTQWYILLEVLFEPFFLSFWIWDLSWW